MQAADRWAILELQGLQGGPQPREAGGGRREEGDGGGPFIPMAEKFRLAYEDRDARIAKAVERNRRRAARRAILRASPAEMAIRLAECGVPLVKVKRKP